MNNNKQRFSPSVSKIWRLFAFLIPLILSVGCQDIGNLTRSSGSDTVEPVINAYQTADNSSEGRRFALIFGNSAYTVMPDALQPLPNPVNDADDISRALRKVGFQVMLRKNATLKQMDDSIYAFGQQLRRDDVALIYYSGHGMQVKGENYLIPVDAQFEREEQIDRASIRAAQMLEQIAEAKTKLVFLDACRNNPFLTRSKRGAVRGGLAKMDSPAGTLLVYATDPNNFAEDGSGRNGTFTKHLLTAIQTPGVDVEIMLRDVRVGVKTETSGKQTPWQTSSLEGAFYFAPTIIINNTTAPAVITPVPTVNNDARLTELEVKRKAEEARLAELVQQRKEAEAVIQLQEIANKRKAEEDRLAELERQRQAAEKKSQRQSFEPEMVSIPAGCFQMGSPSTEKDRDDDEKQHRVCLTAFAIGKYEVTFDEYDAFCSDTGRSKPSDSGWGREKRPVINISWNDANNYVQWLSSKTGRKYELPTEAQWEYAARAGTTTAYWWGNDIGSNKANCDSNYCGDSFQYTAPVGSFSANSWGLYDTVGNVWEWVRDYYDENFYLSSEATFDDPSNSHATSSRVLRGGSWGDVASWYSRAAGRGGVSPDYTGSNFGFRVVRLPQE